LNRGIISIGTNSTRALVAALNGSPQVLLARSIGTRIGEGLKERGHLEDEAMRRTLDAVREHTAAVREVTGDVCAIATSALRRADNGEEFARRVQDIVGAPLEIISGEEEARRSFIGAVSGIDAAAQTSFGVLDVGGGSSEYAVGTKEQASQIVSCEIGAVRLTEGVPELSGTRGPIDDAVIARARDLTMQATAPIAQFSAVDRVVVVGGSATTAVAVHRQVREMFAYASLTRAELQAILARLRALDLDARKALPGMNPQRADILPAGLLIIDVVLERTQHEQALVSTNDLLLGTLLLSRRRA
jgi:exopolyphosphatase/guanosine-5'-triphosphate,3'-diphosphate pyrophosphatase